MIQKINQAVDYIKRKIDIKPDTGLILGSGLGVLAEEIENSIYIKYEDIPNFPVSTVEGHAGQFVIGNLEEKKVIAMQGRFHYYEGYSIKEVILPIRVFYKLGVKNLIVTNAAGGINRNFKPGNFMIIKDHINLLGENPLIGENLKEFGPRFPDMSEVYNKDLIKLAEEVALEYKIKTKKGVYVALSGPSYETPAEIRHLRSIGADAVGMSTVPETITANQMGINILGISCITNMAAGVLPKPLNHKEVMEIAEQVKPKFSKLIKGVLKKM
ncbi:MAG: purine-nucleoside phosphorylase [Halanaerobiales bacterium]|nr:purine-nucleoside phosphorylase [Halanaerobiales bacterium]